MKFIFPICLALIACSHEEVKQEPPPKVHHEAPPPELVPASSNPFDKPPVAITHEPIVNPKWDQVGDGFKINDGWNLWTWKDSANHNICYIFTADTRSGMSCVKE